MAISNDNLKELRLEARKLAGQYLVQGKNKTYYQDIFAKLTEICDKSALDASTILREAIHPKAQKPT